MKNPFRVGERVYLRPIEPEDNPTLLRWINDEEVTRTLGAFMPYNSVREKDWIEALYKSPSDITLLIVRREGDRPLGNCSLRHLPYELPNRYCELGIMIGEKEEQGRGYGTEAIRLLCAYGFERLGLHRIWLRAYDFNGRGLKCYERSGFKLEGRMRETKFFEGRWRDTLVYGLLEHEFRSGEGAGTGAATK